MDRRLSQPQAAQILCVTDETVVNWEKNHTQPDAKHIGRILAFLGYDPLPEPKTLSERLLRARQRLGLSHQHAAARIGVDPSAILDWENEHHQPTPPSMEKIKRLLADAEDCFPPQK